MVAADLAATLGRAIELYGDNPDDAHRDLVLKLLPVLAERLPDAGLAELDVYGEGQLALVMQYE